MKKLYAFAAVAACALSAMAQNGAPLYATGNFAESYWNPSAPVEFAYANGEYSLDITTGSMFKISTTMGSWDDFNAGALACVYGNEPGIAKELTPGTNDIVCPWEADWHIVVAGDLSTLTLTTTTQGTPTETEIYLRGNINGWGADDAWKFESIDGNVYKFVCGDGQYILAGDEFKIADSSWGVVNYGTSGDAIQLDATATLEYNAPNISLSSDFYGVCYFALDKAEVYLSNDRNAACPFEINAVNTVDTENTGSVYFNLQGVRVANPESGLYIVVKGNKTQKVVIK